MLLFHFFYNKTKYYINFYNSLSKLYGRAFRFALRSRRVCHLLEGSHWKKIKKLKKSNKNHENEKWFDRSLKKKVKTCN